MPATQAANFNGARVVSFDSSRATDFGHLIKRYGGVPVFAPAMRETPIERNQEAFRFAEQLLAEQFDMVIFLSAAGARALTDVIESRYSREAFASALRKVRVVAVGPASAAEINELGVSVDINAPDSGEDLLEAIRPLQAGSRVAVQEHGEPSEELLDHLRDAGAQVLSVPVYRWELPDDLRPLQQAIGGMAGGRVQVALFTASVQVGHVFQVAAEMNLAKRLRLALVGMMVASVSPACSQALHQYGIHVDMEPSRPEMGSLVREAAERSAQILASKR